MRAGDGYSRAVPFREQSYACRISAGPLAEMLAAGLGVRMLDLNPANIGQGRFGVIVENSGTAMQSAIDFPDLILCTGSTLCNGTIVNYILPDKEVLFYGISAAGASQLLGLKRICFADKFGKGVVLSCE